MKLTEKVLAVLLAVLLTAAVLPTAFAADDDVIATGSGGEGITWTLTEGGLLTVSGNGPIVDEEEVEYDSEGYASTNKLDCIGWQLYAVYEERTEELGAKEKALALFDFIKEIVIEEGVTYVPDDEFSDFYPRHITLPSTLEGIGSNSFDAHFTETLTINSKKLEINGNIPAAGHNSGAEPYETIEDAIEAKIDFELASREIDDLQAPVYDLGSAYEIKLGLSEDITEEEFISNFNEYYGTDMADLDACIAYFIGVINNNFGRNYTSADQIYTVVEEDDVKYLERDPSLDEQITGMYEAAAFDENKFTDVNLGAAEEGVVAYSWLTVYGPSGSGAEKSAKVSGVNFVATTEPDSPVSGFFAKIKSAFEAVKTFVVGIINWIKLQLSLIK